MMRTIETLAVVTVLGAMFFLGRMSKKDINVVENTTVKDTLWVTVHDTAIVERSVTLLRHDTIKLAYVPDIEFSGTFEQADGHENTDSGTHTDTVYVSVPISEQVFEGENYTIKTEGYAVRLNDVLISYPTITATSTVTRRKRWAVGIGVQTGYGMTLNGLSPYAGVGISFGYTF